MVAQYREDTLRQTLQNLSEIAPDIRAAVIVNVDGLVVASYPSHNTDVHDPLGDQSVAATTALIIGLAKQTLDRLDQGGLERIMIEGAEGAIGVLPCTHDAALAVLIKKDSKIGLALNAARRASNQIRSVLDQ